MGVSMLIVGDLSGIQEYLFDIAHEGGGQARRLRARSFFIQLLAECAALRVIRAAQWSQDELIFCGAGKFIVEGPELPSERRMAVEAEGKEIERWLLNSTRAQLRFALAIDASESADKPEEHEHQGPNPASKSSGPVGAREQFQQVMKTLQRAKLTAWASLAAYNGQWHTATLALDPLDTPCALCRHQSAETDEDLDDGSKRRVCSRCHGDLEWGRKLPQTRWVALSEVQSHATSQALGFDVSLEKETPKAGDFLIYIDKPAAPLVSGFNENQIITRQLTRHIPVDRNHRPIDFAEIASRARGDKLLGVLKADADSLGLIIDQTLKEARDLSPLTQLSRELDDFFAGTLASELSKREWENIYTIFAGGDDLMLLGPWNVVVDFAGYVHDLFQAKFARRGMTLSAAVAFLKPRRPIRFGAEQAEHLLEQAKTEAALNHTEPKDQVAAFGQIWKWRDHTNIMRAGQQLVQWFGVKALERGWLHTLLEIALSRHNGELRATSRLAYHVARNYPRVTDRDPAKAELRRWANRLVNELDELKTVDTIYLPAIARYALTATRSRQED
jgi:CRISPR-associated protein Csm1